MPYKVAIDDGHGIETPGKRTPAFPDGTVIRENQFNAPTAKKLGEALKRCGIDVIFVAPEETDTSLATRVSRANKANADIFVSVHYNAFKGVWGDHGGIKTYHYPGSTKGEKLAKCIQKYVKNGTPMRDRGIDSANFYVLRKTSMPAALVECGFMDNMNEAKLMLDPAYQEETAEEICQGVCEYLGVKYVPKPEPKKEEKTAGKLYRVQVGVFSKKENAEKLVNELKKKGYSAIIKEE
jgi:N-acetylmuramoyl-L-alanine amidase